MSCVNFLVLLILVEPEISVLSQVPPSHSIRHDKYVICIRFYKSHLKNSYILDPRFYFGVKYFIGYDTVYDYKDLTTRNHQILQKLQKTLLHSPQRVNSVTVYCLHCQNGIV